MEPSKSLPLDVNINSKKLTCKNHELQDISSLLPGKLKPGNKYGVLLVARLLHQLTSMNLVLEMFPIKPL